MKFISSFTKSANNLNYKAEYKVTTGVDKTEYAAIQLVSDIYKKKFDYTVKMSEVKKSVDKKNNSSVIRVVDVSLVFVDGVITEVQPFNSPEVKEVTRALRAQSKIANQL